MLTPGEAPKKPVLSLAYQVRFKPSSRLASNVKREEGRREEGRREDSSAVHLGGPGGREQAPVAPRWPGAGP